LNQPHWAAVWSLANLPAAHHEKRNANETLAPPPLFSSCRKEVEGRSRNYYQLTARGRRRLEALTAEWNRVAAGISLVMGLA
jgi:hypothetical protein